MTSPAGASSIDAVSVKLPPVWTHKIASWFAQAEAQFNIRKITEDDTMYWHIIAALTGDVAERAARIIDDPPKTQKYKAIKTFLLRRYSLTESQRADKLLAITSLGDRSPTELADEMLRINGENDPGHFLLRRLFVRALPVSVRQQLASADQEDIYTLAEEAEKINLATPSGFNDVAVVNTGDEEDMQPSLCRVSNSSHRRKNSQQKFRHDDDKEVSFCYFHRTYGNKARSCRPPCSWPHSGNLQQGTRRQ